jgi:hypothetical protein
MPKDHLAAIGNTIYSEGASYRSILTLDGRAGYEVTFLDGTVRYVYMNPSSEDNMHEENIFIYEGPTLDIGDGKPLVSNVVNK